MQQLPQALFALMDMAKESAVRINRERHIDALLNGTEYIPITKEDTVEFKEYKRLVRVFENIARAGVC